MYTAFFDGSYSPKWKKCNIGFVIYGPDRGLVRGASREAGRGDSHIAECKALLSVVCALQNLKVSTARIFGDDQSLIDQVCSGVKAGASGMYIEPIKIIFSKNPGWQLTWIPRGDNRIADALSKSGVPEEVPKILPQMLFPSNLPRNVHKIGETAYLVFDRGIDRLVDMSDQSCSCRAFSGSKDKCRHIEYLEIFLEEHGQSENTSRL